VENEKIMLGKYGEQVWIILSSKRMEIVKFLVVSCRSGLYKVDSKVLRTWFKRIKVCMPLKVVAMTRSMVKDSVK
jgi:hypothetical protein